MPRPWRVEFAGACYHVINRGNYRRELFRGKGAPEAFERTLDEAASRFGWRIHAYAIMSNHFHLALELGEPNLSEGMKWLQGTWIRRFNSYRRLVGRPFQGRYKAILVEKGEAFARVCHYIHLNPVRAGVVGVTAITDYAWSSLPKFLAKTRPVWLESSTVLNQAGELPDSPTGWECYLQYLRSLFDDPQAKRSLSAEKLSRGWCLGTASFKAHVRERHALRGALLDRFAGLEPDVLKAERENEWRRTLQQFAGDAGVRLDCLPKVKSHPDKVLLAAALKSGTSASNRWIAAVLQLGCPSSVSSLVTRFRRSSLANQRLQALLGH